MNGGVPLLQIIRTGFLIFGNLFGAGILSLPINTGLAGFIPSQIVSTLVSLFN